MIRTDGVIWLDYNPTARFWVNDEYEGAEGVEWLVLTYKDNQALPDTILNELHSRREKAKTSTYWANWCKVYLDGEIGTLEGVCIPDWKELERLPQNKTGNLECRLLCYGLDFGYSNDPTSLVALYKWNDAYIFDELIYKKKMLNSDISDMLKSLKVDDYVYADSAEPKSIDELKMAGHKVLPCSKGRDSIVYGIELINQNKIYITSRSRNLIKELYSYVWKTDKDGVTLNQPVDAFNHAIDAARYALMEQLKDPHKGEYYIY
jgi:phage terminase large subunit